MNARPLAIQDLEDFQTNEVAIQNMRNEIQELRACADGLKATDYEAASMPKGGYTGNAEEDRVIGMMDRARSLQLNLDHIESKQARIRQALGRLNERHMRILWVFHVYRPEDHIGVLTAELGIERSQIYDEHRAALRHFVKLLYGIVDG